MIGDTSIDFHREIERILFVVTLHIDSTLFILLYHSLPFGAFRSPLLPHPPLTGCGGLVVQDFVFLPGEQFFDHDGLL